VNWRDRVAARVRVPLADCVRLGLGSGSGAGSLELAEFFGQCQVLGLRLAELVGQNDELRLLSATGFVELLTQRGCALGNDLRLAWDRRTA
jgi:hypothetical protein